MIQKENYTPQWKEFLNSRYRTFADPDLPGMLTVFPFGSQDGGGEMYHCVFEDPWNSWYEQMSKDTLLKKYNIDIDKQPIADYVGKQEFKLEMFAFLETAYQVSVSEEKFEDIILSLVNKPIEQDMI